MVNGFYFWIASGYLKLLEIGNVVTIPKWFWKAKNIKFRRFDAYGKMLLLKPKTGPQLPKIEGVGAHKIREIRVFKLHSLREVFP